MSDLESNLIEKARQIAFEIISRREAGEEISENHVVDEFPHLAKYVNQHLQRFRKLRMARQTPLRETEVRSVSSAEHDATEEELTANSNLRMTSIIDGDQGIDDIRNTLVVERNLETDNVSADELIERTELFRPTNRPPMGVLKLFLDGSRNFSPIPVFTDSFLIGRTDGQLRIEHDPRISGRHVEIQRRGTKSSFDWYLVDQGSTNGTFVRVDHAVLKHDDEILVGKERYRFVHEKGRVGLSIVSDDSSDTWYLTSNVNWIGRSVEGAIESMRNDPFADARHAIVRARANNQWVVVNNDSVNGLWFRISEIRMTGNCSFQIGEQRFGFRT